MTDQELARLISRVGLQGALKSGALDASVREDAAEVAGVAVNAAKSEINTAMQAALKNVSSSEKTNVLSKNMFGRFDSEVLSTVHTTNIVVDLEAPFTGLRIGLHNIHTAAVPGVRVCVAVRDKLDYDNNDARWAGECQLSGGTWIDCTFDGSVSGTLAPRIAAERTSVTWTDIVPLQSIPRTDGGVRPIILVRVELPNGSVLTRPYNQTYNWRGDQAARYFRTSKQSVAGVTNKSAFTQLANTEASTICPAIQYYSTKAGRQLLIVADSTLEGIGSNPTCYGAAQQAALTSSTVDNPVEYWNGALHAQVPLTYTPRIADLLPVVNPTHLFYSPWSGNDVAAGGIQDDALMRSRQALSMAMGYLANYKAPVKVVMAEGLPTTTAGRNTGAGDAKRVAYNTWLSTFTGFTPAVGYAQAVSGATVGGQVQLDSTLTTDGVHPNRAGYDKLAAVIKPLLFGS